MREDNKAFAPFWKPFGKYSYHPEIQPEVRDEVNLKNTGSTPGASATSATRRYNMLPTVAPATCPSEKGELVTWNRLQICQINLGPLN
ncbi:hypothetical protein ACLOJK_030831 [Asimina triloba]